MQRFTVVLSSNSQIEWVHIMNTYTISRTSEGVSPVLKLGEMRCRMNPFWGGAFVYIRQGAQVCLDIQS